MREFLAIFIAILATAWIGCEPTGGAVNAEDKEPHFLEGRRQMQQRDFEGAERSFHKALAANPAPHWPITKLGYFTSLANLPQPRPSIISNAISASSPTLPTARMSKTTSKHSRAIWQGIFSAHHSTRPTQPSNNFARSSTKWPPKIRPYGISSNPAALTPIRARPPTARFNYLNPAAPQLHRHR